MLTRLATAGGKEGVMVGSFVIIRTASQKGELGEMKWDEIMFNKERYVHLGTENQMQ